MRVARIIKLVSCLCLLAVASLSAQSTGTSLIDSLKTEGNQPVKPFRIIGNIYYVGASDITSYLITTPEGNILIDTGFEATVPIIRKSIEQLGFKVKDIKIMLSGHAHIDHVEGHPLMKEITGAKIMAMEEDAATIERGGSPDMAGKWKPTKVDRVLHDGDTVSLGGTTLQAHRTPGHTKGNTTWTTKVTENGKSYDVVFYGSTTVNDGVLLVNNPTYPNIASDYEKSFRFLKSLNPDVFLAPHGRFFHLTEKMKMLGSASNPFIDPDGYQKFLQQSEQAFRKELAKQTGQQ